MFSDRMTKEDWTHFGFEEVWEVVPERIYEVWGPGFQHFRISVIELIVGGSAVPWNTSIEESVTIAGDNGQTFTGWVQAENIADRHLGENVHAACRALDLRPHGSHVNGRRLG